MERRSKQQKYVQMIIPNNSNPVSLKLNKENVLEISFLPRNKDSDFQQDQIWIPPPAKTSRRLPGSPKYPKNNIIICVPTDRTIETINSQTYRIDLGKKQEKMKQEKLINASIEDNKMSELQEQTQRLKGTVEDQEHILGVAEELLKKHENKQKILSKYCRALTKNMQDIAKSIKEMENQDNMSRKTKSMEKIKVHYNDEDQDQQSIRSSLKQKTAGRETGRNSEEENINGDQSPNKESSSGRNFGRFNEGSQMQKLKRKVSIENVSMMYLPHDKSSREESEGSDTRQSKGTETKKDKARKQMATQPCIPTENLMIKLSDKIRKTKLLLDSVYQKDADMDLVQRKYVSEVEKLYREQEELLEKLNQTLGKANSYATIDSSESFQVDDEQIQDDNATEKSSVQGQTKGMKNEERSQRSFPDIQLRKETRSLEDQLECDDPKLTTLKDKLESTKTLQSKYEPGLNERECLTIDRDLPNSPINQSNLQRPSLRKKPVTPSFKKDGFKDKDCPNEITLKDSLKNDDYSCQTEITQVVRHLPPDKSGKSNLTNNQKVDDASKSDSYISETKITQKLRFLPLNSKERMNTNIAPPITDILKDINRSIDNVKPFGSYTWPEIEYQSIEEGSLTLDDTSYKRVLPQAYYEKDTSKTRDESTKISERSDYNKNQKYQTQMDNYKCQKNGRTKSDFGREEYSLTNENTRPKYVLQKSYNKNGTSKMQGETTKVSERSDNNKARQKYQMPNEYNQYIESERGTQSNQYDSITEDGSSQSFTQLSMMHECDCSGECKNSRHFSAVSSYRNPPKTEDQRKKKNKFSFLPNERIIDDDIFKSKNNYQSNEDVTGYDSSQSFTQLSTMHECDCYGECTNPRHFPASRNYQSPPKTEDKSKKKNKFSFSRNESQPLAESTRIDDDNYRSKKDYQRKKSDPPGVKTNSKHENKFRFHSNQTPLAESTRIDDDNFKSKYDNQRKKSDPSRVKKNKTQQENKFSFQLNQTPLAESSRRDCGTFDSETDKNKKFDPINIEDKSRQENKEGTSNDAYDQPIYSRHRQTMMNEFLYAIPIMPKEKFPHTTFANAPKKVIQCEYKNSSTSSTENDKSVISNMEKASDKINALYKDIMFQF